MEIKMLESNTYIILKMIEIRIDRFSQFSTIIDWINLKNHASLKSDLSGHCVRHKIIFENSENQ